MSLDNRRNNCISKIFGQKKFGKIYYLNIDNETKMKSILFETEITNIDGKIVTIYCGGIPWGDSPHSPPFI